MDVTVAAFRSKKVYVTGSVGQPGTYPITNIPLRLVDAISAAGGISETADWSNVLLTRDGRDYSLSLRNIYQDGNAAQNILLQPGDVINVARAEENKVFVLGEVMRPSSLPMGRNGMTLAEALSEKGGLDPRSSDASGVFVFRKAPAGADHGIDVTNLTPRTPPPWCWRTVSLCNPGTSSTSPPRRWPAGTGCSVCLCRRQALFISGVRPKMS